jgi:hypothetical protein
LVGVQMSKTLGGMASRWMLAFGKLAATTAGGKHLGRLAELDTGDESRTLSRSIPDLVVGEEAQTQLV